MAKLGLLLLILTAAGLAASVPVNAARAQADYELTSGYLEYVNLAAETVTMDGITYEVPSGVANLSLYSAGDGVELAYVRTETGALRAVSLGALPPS